MDKDFWDDAYRDDPDNVEVMDFVVAQAVEQLPVGRALDLGCGLGTNALLLAARGWSVVGVDWAERAVQMANQAARERGLAASFYTADITTWESADRFDLVISTYALPGGEDGQRVLQTAMTVLAPGGTLLVAEWDRAMGKIWGIDEDELYSPEQIAAMLPDLVIQQAEVLHREDVFPVDDPRAQFGTAASIALVRAHKPQD